MALVKKAQGSKPPIGRLADHVSAVFVPAIMLIAVVAALAWFNLGPEPRITHMLISATTVLIIACPCALGLATPMSVMVGVGKAAEHGILIREGDALQTSSKLDTIVLDKTGTITEGKPALTEIICAEGQQEDTLLQLAASLESGSEHPLARAIVGAAEQREISPDRADNFQALNGKGVSATLNGKQYRLGNRRWLESEGITVSLNSDSLTERGATPVPGRRQHPARHPRRGRPYQGRFPGGHCPSERSGPHRGDDDRRHPGQRRRHRQTGGRGSGDGGSAA